MSDTDWNSGEPEDDDSESETAEQSLSDTDWDSAEPEDIRPESGNDWYFAKPKDEDPESKADRLSGSYTDWYFAKPNDADPESKVDQLSGTDTVWDSGETEDEDSESETAKQSRSDNDWDFDEPEDDDTELESSERSRSDTDWDSGEPEDGDTESESSEQSRSATDWDSGEPEDDDSESETSEQSRSDTDWDYGKLEAEDRESEAEDLTGSDTGDSESETSEQSGSDNYWNSGESESDTDTLTSDTEWGTQNLNFQDSAISSELNKLFKLKDNLGKHLSKKVAHLLKSRPTLSAYFREELNDASHHSPNVRIADLHGLPKSLHGTARRSHRSSQNNQKPVPVEAPEQDTIKKENGHVPIKRPNTVFMKTISSVGQVFETQKANGLKQHISRKLAEMLTRSGSSWSGIPMPQGRNGVLNLNIRLDSLGNQGLRTKKTEGHKSEKEREGAIVRALVTLFFFGGLFMVLMMAACFAFTW